jgi:hypothetical protein
VTTTAPHTIGAVYRPGWLSRGGSLFFAVALFGAARRKKGLPAVFLLVLATLALTSVGCGGSGGGSPSDSGTPTGTYSVVVTGTSGGITQTANVSVTVQ